MTRDLQISASCCFHWVKRLSAQSHFAGSVKLVMHGADGVIEHQYNQAEVIIFFDDDAMAQRVMAAINSADLIPESAS